MTYSTLDQLKVKLLEGGFINLLLPLMDIYDFPEVQGNSAAAIGNLVTNCKNQISPRMSILTIIMIQTNPKEIRFGDLTYRHSNLFPKKKKLSE